MMYKVEGDQLRGVINETNRLKEENAKLRDVAENLAMIANGCVCDYYHRDEMLARANAELRELGIEVGA